METLTVLLTIWVMNSPTTGEFPAQRPVTWSFDVFFDLRLYICLSKQSWGWWFETPSRPLWRDCDVNEKKMVPQLKWRVLSVIGTNWNSNFHVYHRIAFPLYLQVSMGKLYRCYNYKDNIVLVAIPCIGIFWKWFQPNLSWTIWVNLLCKICPTCLKKKMTDTIKFIRRLSV